MSKDKENSLSFGFKYVNLSQAPIMTVGALCDDANDRIDLIMKDVLETIQNDGKAGDLVERIVYEIGEIGIQLLRSRVLLLESTNLRPNGFEKVLDDTVNEIRNRSALLIKSCPSRSERIQVILDDLNEYATMKKEMYDALNEKSESENVEK